MKGPEHAVKEDIKALLDSLQTWHFMPVPTGYGRRGISDFIICLPVTITQEMVGKRVGLFAAIEAKAEHGALTPWQRKELDKVQAAGGIALVAQAPGHIAAIRSGLVL